MTQPTRRIEWSAADHDYAMYLDGEFVGFARSHVDAETALDRMVFDRLTAQSTADKAELVAQFSEAYKAAKADGRLLDAALYRREGLALLAELKGVTIEELTGKAA